MSYLREFARLTESVRVLESQLEHMLQDKELLRELEFEKKCNALLDEYGVPVELLIDVVLSRPDVPRAIRRQLAEVHSSKNEPPVSAPPGQRRTNVAPETDPRPASGNAAAWREKFGHRSFESWFKLGSSECD